MSIFSDVEEAAPIEVFHLVKVFTEDEHPSKVNLTIGGTYTPVSHALYVSKFRSIYNCFFFLCFLAYRTDDGKPYYIPVVKKAEGMVLESTTNHEYLPILGLESFTKSASQLLLGDIAKRQEEGTVIIYYALVTCK